MVGVPFLEPAGVEGDLEADIPKLDRDSILATFVRDSPEIKRAQAGVERARSTLARAKAEPTPDVLLRGGFGYNFEELDILSGPVGWEGFIEVGFRVPLFDRNQGNIAAAKAEIDRAEGEVKRLEHAELLGFRLSLGLFLLMRKDVSALLELTCRHNGLFKKE